ncbi:geranylgeranyl diphosphate synthase 1 [Aureobasidium sp. EXF-12298]|nr:geranylgeranyl diphosphate synthase 1 [Aureobasidium sp. EXF-12298]KAI4755413.1 geranylgeranyl diphosphate synthase 1 [Aureobasidium sp. EXF-12344]KAI4772472.1 geranylgeranyl diphosphate synthase 1 [Aureobasidium sp. EXF-3400]
MALDAVSGAMPVPSQTSPSNTTTTNGTKSHDDSLTSPKMHPQTHIYPPPLSPPPEDPMHNICDDLIFSQGTTKWPQEKDRILLAPYDYLDGHPGKDIRSLLIGAFNAWLHVPKPSLDIITQVVGMLHTASLLIDDVEDSSVLRRGVPVAHNIFGTAQTINSANYVYFCALRELMKLNNPQAIEIYNDELLNLHRGQGMDLFWRDSLTCPSEHDYLEMVGNKTGGLFRLAIKLMQAESSVPIDCVPLCNTIGLLYQIRDDYKNLSDTIYTQNKGLCEDLTEGKFSFPVIHSIRSDPQNLVLINILKQKPQDEEIKRYAVKYMEKTGSFAVLRGLAKKALALVDDLDKDRNEGEAIRKILDKMQVDEPHAELERSLSSSSSSS